MQPMSFLDAFLSLKASHGGRVTSRAIRQVLEETGLRVSEDARLAALDRELTRADIDPSLDLDEFCNVMSGDGGLLAMSALQGRLSVPDFSAFRESARRAFDAVASGDPVGREPSPPKRCPGLGVLDDSYPAARNADYIPALSSAEDGWGVSVCTVDGQRLVLGDADRLFSIQSCCKPVNYAKALESFNLDEPGYNPGGGESAEVKLDRLLRRAEARKVNRLGTLDSEERLLGVHDFVDCEPSGQAFNGFSFNGRRMPYNPLINAGAVMCSALVSRAGPTDIELEQVQKAWQALAGMARAPLPDTKTAKGESRTGSNNRSLAYKMMANEAFPAFVQTDDDVESVLDFYFHCCALMMSAEEMAVAAATLANKGICPTTGERVFRPATVRDTLAAMLHCGMYDASGRFGRLVGLPAKSGVGGAIFIVVPGVMGICTFSPRLDKVGNSLRGLDFIERLLEAYGLHMLDATEGITARRADPRASRLRTVADPVQRVMTAAVLGDVTAFERFSGQVVSRSRFLELLNMEDYDGRRPIHLAVAEGHAEAVSYLLEQGVEHSAADRWGSTPLREAEACGNAAAAELLRSRGATMGDCEPPASVEAGLLARVRESFEEGERPHATNAVEELELIWAAARGDLNHIRRLAASGARLLVCDYDNRTPLHLACAECRPEIVDFIVRYFRDVSERREASRQRLEFLLSWPDRWGRTPFDDLPADEDLKDAPETDARAAAATACRAILSEVRACGFDDLASSAGSKPLGRVVETT